MMGVGVGEDAGTWESRMWEFGRDSYEDGRSSEAMLTQRNASIFFERLFKASPKSALLSFTVCCFGDKSYYCCSHQVRRRFGLRSHSRGVVQITLSQYVTCTIG